MTYFSKRTAWNTAPNALSLKIREIREAGAPLLDLTGSNPTRCSLPYPANAILEAFQNPKNLDYDPDPRGLLVARKAVADYYAGKNIPLSPEQIFLTANTSEAYSFVFRLLCNPDDTVLAPSPSYPILDYLTNLHDIRCERYPVIATGQTWHLSPESLERKIRECRPKAILAVHPNNPTGNYVSEREYQGLTNGLHPEDVPLLSDEVFFDYPLRETSPAPRSFASRNDVLTFTLSGISKILGLPQMKLSWIVVTGPPQKLEPAISRLEILSDTYLSVGTPVQNALPSLMALKDTLQTGIGERIRANYLSLKNAFLGKKGIRTTDADGGWVAVLEMPSTKTDDEWALFLLEKAGVLLHPGYLYDFTGEHYLVASLLTPPEVFKQALQIISNLSV